MSIFGHVFPASILLAVLLSCGFAQAQAASELIPPVPQSSTDVPYPEGAEGNAEVVLELVVERDGAVSSATVVDGAEPFAQQARAATLTWRFVPARRGDTPVIARIRASIAFHREQEAPVFTGAPTGAPSAAAGSATAKDPAVAAPPEPPLEVTVQGERREIGQTTLSKSDVREMPGAFGDAFRAVEALPGVTPLASGLPYFFVRGAPPNNAGYFVDGIRVPLLFHLGLGQSVIHPGLVDHVDFFPSAAPARYGGYAGGIIAGQTREPASALHGEANLRLVDAGALVETPFADGRGTALVAGRYGYPGPILALATDTMKIGYWDYQARTSWKLTPRDTIGIFAFGSHDYLATRSPSSDPEASRELQEQFVSDFHRVDLRYSHALDDGQIRLALTGGYDSQGASPTYVTNESLAARLEVTNRFSDSLRFRGGADARVDHYGSRTTKRGPFEPVIPQSADPPPTNLGAGFYADLVWRVTRRVELVPGARLDLFASSRHDPAPGTGSTRTIVPAVDPRLSARVALAPGVVWLSTLGLAHQYPSLRIGNVPAPILSVPGFPFETRQLQTAAQASQGLEVILPADLTVTATAFYSRFWGLTDLSASCFQLSRGMAPAIMDQPHAAPYVCPNNQPVRGQAYGLELLVRRPFTKRLSGWLSYTLSRSTRQAHFITPTGGEDLLNVASDFDRTHVLNAILGYDLGRRWRVGSRLVFYTGTPYSQLDGSISIPPYNAYRTPAFYRLDVRLEKRWPLGQNGSLAFVLEGQNVTLRKEVTGLGMDCEGMPMAQTEITNCKRTEIGPLTIPSVGLEAFF
jgi:TonB-dependent receptor-like protein